MATPKRGGQPSNVNSRRHGFYAKKLDADLLPQFAQATKIVGLDQEIAFYRLKLQTLSAGKSLQEIALSLQCGIVIARLTKTQHDISIDHDESLKNAISLVLNEIAAPLKIKKLIR